LVADGVRVAVAHVGNSGLMVRTLESIIPPGDATLVVEIDGRRNTKHILLPEGISQSNTFVKFF